MLLRYLCLYSKLVRCLGQWDLHGLETLARLCNDFATLGRHNKPALVSEQRRSHGLGVYLIFCNKITYVCTGQFQMKFMVQQRQWRRQHPDSHYAAATFRYMREYALLLRDHCSFICVDDKQSKSWGTRVSCGIC